MASETQRDMVIPPNSYAFVLDMSSGFVNTLVGGTKTPLGEQQKAVVFDSKTRKFVQVEGNNGIQNFLFAPQGSYIALQNPAKVVPGQNEHPVTGNMNQTPPLDFGNTVNITGPANFALWPLQVGEVIEGHSLRSNQYIMARIVDADTAKNNWKKQISAAATVDATKSEIPSTVIQTSQTFASIDVNNLVTGQLFIIRGTEISFYIPPSGVEILTDERTKSKVQNALTLEALEYGILVNERGEKRYPIGPAVVFPDPTETFLTRKNAAGEETRRFRAIDLSQLQGIYVQVIQPYNDDGEPADPAIRVTAGLQPRTPDHKAGDELFITGAEQPIYYPNPNHAIIRYGDTSEKHNAVAIPLGEGRYVLNRLTGAIPLIKGPKMLLANAITEVIVRRILPQKKCGLYFPGNTEAAEYNKMLEQMADEADLTSRSFVSENTLRSRTSNLVAAASAGSDYYKSPAAGAPQFGSAVQRGSSYTPPRMVTLDTKYDGAVAISPWAGFAVQIVSKTGERHVIVGPATHLLEYHEELDVLSLSRETPKNHDKLTQTVYLQISNNRVTDLYQVETRDMVKVSIKASCRLNFEGDTSKWFAVDNYVKLLCQNLKSRLAAVAKQHDIGEFYNDAIAIVRDAILGPDVEDGERKGLVFVENGMHVYDVEVLTVTINDDSINQLLQKTMVDTFKTQLELANARRLLQATQERELISRQIADVTAESQKLSIQRQVEQAICNFTANMKQREQEIADQAILLQIEQGRQAILDQTNHSQIEREKEDANKEMELSRMKQQQELEMIAAETTAVIDRIKGIQGPLGDVLLALSSQETMRLLAEASAPMSILGGSNLTDVIAKSLNGTGFVTAFEDAKVSSGIKQGVGNLIRNGLAAVRKD